MDFNLENIEDNEMHFAPINISSYELKKWTSIKACLLNQAIKRMQEFVQALNDKGYNVTLIIGTDPLLVLYDSFDFILIFKSMTGREIGVNATCQNNIGQIVDDIDWKYKSMAGFNFSFCWSFSKR